MDNFQHQSGVPKKTILFFAQVYFLDTAVEYIKILSQNNYHVHVLIELAPSQLKSNVFNLEVDLTRYEAITSFWNVIHDWQLYYLESYFTKCASVNFVIYKFATKPSVIFSTTKKVYSFINKIKPDYFHFDGGSPRQCFLLPFLIRQKKKFILNVHDPKHHTGEFEWKRFLIEESLQRYFPVLVAYSKFSKNALKEKFKTKKESCFDLKLLPYTVFEKFLKKEYQNTPRKAITFFGRISPYKGIDLFTQAIEELSTIFPEQTFIIAGKPEDDYIPVYSSALKQNKNLTILHKHITNEEVANIITQSQLIVCPYKEATQSGVIMTAYALNCPVLITQVGGLPEYVVPDTTGLIAKDITSKSLVESISKFLIDEKFEFMHQHLKNKMFSVPAIDYNLKIMNKLYA